MGKYGKYIWETHSDFRCHWNDGGIIPRPTVIQIDNHRHAKLLLRMILDVLCTTDHDVAPHFQG